MRFPLLPIAVIAIPLAEIAGFVVVGSRIGALATVGLVVASAVAGLVLLRLQGLGTIRRIQADIEADRNPGRGLAHAAMIALAGILLLIPGFLTSTIGLLLFVPPVRDLAWRVLRSRLRFATGFVSFGARVRRGGKGRTLDLEENEFSRKPRDEPPDRRLTG